MAHHPDKSAEYVFQNDIIAHLKANGWLVGTVSKYNRELALNTEETLAYVKESQPDQWEKYCGIYPTNTETKFLERLASQLNKADPNAANKELRTYGTLGVLRQEIKIVARGSVCVSSSPSMI
ncbi:MAG: hypothetical protein AB8B97_02720 [Granulosicoccus sp.]